MKKALLTTAMVLATTAAANAADINKFSQTNFVANKAKYGANFKTDERFVNAWGIATRPKGAGGHFWVTSKDMSYQYVGDVTASDNVALQKLSDKTIPEVKLPVGGDDAFATGVVFVDSKEDFVITQEIDGKEAITAPAKFIFASDGGVISAWTERKLADGSFDRSPSALAVIDESEKGSSFFGIAMSSNYDRLYAADFGAAPAIKVFDGDFKAAGIQFDQPFDENGNGKVDAGEYAPFNVQSFGKSIYVAYAKTQVCPAEEVEAGSCGAGELFVGEEDTSAAGMGRVAEFNEDGTLIATLNDGGKLSAPWGFAIAPANWGALSNTLLVTNFGDGTIAAYDQKTRNFVDVVRNEKGEPLEIDKIWGITFGNGESLGDSDTLYFAAGPEDEEDGLFGKLRLAESK